ncbi:MAG TPA: PEP-CTERM sorting domain-containing protein [Methylotenera sp.]
MNIKVFILFMGLLVGIFSPSLRAELPAGYDLTLIPQLDGTPSINNQGQISGYTLINNSIYAAIWQNGTITNLGSGIPTAINNSGQVAGVNVSGAVLWSNGQSIALPNLHSGDNTQVWGINDAGQVVGWSGSFVNVPVVWNGTNITQLSPALAEGEARAINNNGQITGYGNVGSYLEPELHAMLWNGDTVTDLGTLNGQNVQNFSTGQSINDAGQIVGSSAFAASVNHAFLWDSGVMTDLGALGNSMSLSEAWDINNKGQIVGDATYTFDGGVNAVVWDGGKIYNLNSFLSPEISQAGWVLLQAFSINDHGQITGGAVNYSLGTGSTFLLTPSLVPEPETYAMMLVGLSVLGFIRRRKQGVLLT